MQEIGRRFGHIKKNGDAEKKLKGKTVGDMTTQYWRGYIQRGKEILGEKVVGVGERVKNKP